MKRGKTGVLFIVLIVGMIWYVAQTVEAFQNQSGEEEGNEGKEGLASQRCGIGLPPCRRGRGWEGIRCVNGYCKSDRM
jgi:hypothetical protein